MSNTLAWDYKQQSRANKRTKQRIEKQLTMGGQHDEKDI